MNPCPPQPLPRENAASGGKAASQNHAVHYPPIAHAQLARPAPKSEAIENGDKTAGCVGRQEEQSGSFCRGYSPPKIAFLAATLFEFALLFGLILIQYISCQIQPSLFFIAAALALLLHALLAAVTASLTIVPAYPHPHSHPHPALKSFCRKGSGLGKSEQGIPTVPKINEAQCQRANAKTKKLRPVGPAAAESSELTLKGKMGQEELHYGLLAVKKKVLVVLKAVQAVFEVVVPSVSLALHYPAIKNSQSLLALSLAAYLLTPASLLAFCLFLRQLRSALHPPVLSEPPLHPQHPLEGETITRVSIDQMILHARSCDIHSVTLEQELRSPHNDGKSEPDRKAAPFRMQQIKKSVLKSSKTHDLRSRKASEDEEVVERRKVGFNSKKLQCFEYLEITPPHSAAEEESSGKKERGAKGGQRLKYMRHRLESEAQILRCKALNREGRTKSLGTVRNQETSPEASGGLNEDPFC